MTKPNIDAYAKAWEALDVWRGNNPELFDSFTSMVVDLSSQRSPLGTIKQWAEYIKLVEAHDIAAKNLFFSQAGIDRIRAHALAIGKQDELKALCSYSGPHDLDTGWFAYRKLKERVRNAVEC
jgi:hypothetical protein